MTVAIVHFGRDALGSRLAAVPAYGRFRLGAGAGGQAAAAGASLGCSIFGHGASHISDRVVQTVTRHDD